MGSVLLVFQFSVLCLLWGLCCSSFGFLYCIFCGVCDARLLVFCVVFFVGSVLLVFWFFVLCFIGGVRVAHLFSFLCCVFDGVRVAQSLVSCVMVGRILMGFVCLYL